MSSTPATHPPAARARLDTIDVVRGFVMVVMLLDHTRDFVHAATFQMDPTDLSRVSPALFLTRWITHYCAPTFVFLAGTSAYLQHLRGKSPGDLSRLLVTRGLWLIAFELTVIRFLAFSGVTFATPFFLQVIWAIGIGMICLAALSRLPVAVTGAIGVATIALHNVADGRIVATPWRGPGTPVPDAADKIITLLHQLGPFPIAGWPSPVVFVLYPLIPWIGVMAAGWAFGTVYALDAERRRRVLVRLGLALTALFVVLRALDAYGDPLGWQLHHPRGPIYSALSFLNTQKYPPSLLYLLMTLGPAITALGLLEPRGASTTRGPLARALTRWLVTFGRVPLFFYVLQWVYSHTTGLVLGLAAGQSVAHLLPDGAFGTVPQNVGFNLAVVYVCWMLGVLVLYPLCRWFAGVKARRRDWWLSYL